MQAFPPIQELLPHRPPMVLLDEVLNWHDERIVCAATTRAGTPFVDSGRMRAVVALEYMAQCVAALAGLLALARGEQVRIGFLVAVREMDLTCDWISLGAKLVVEAERTWGDRLLGHFHCRVCEGDEVLARASLSVVREDALEPS